MKRPEIDPTYRIHFDRDHYMHPGFDEEWWYFSGLFACAENQHTQYIYNFTLYKNDALFTTTAVVQEKDSGKKYLCNIAHELEGQAHQLNQLHVHNGDSYVYYHAQKDLWEFGFSQGGFACDLRVTPDRGYVLNGANGYIQQGPVGLSAYYSAQSMRLHGHVSVDNQKHEVAGRQSWLDRQWGNFAHDPRSFMYNWFSFRFSDDTTLMFYRFRDEQYKLLPAYCTATYQAQDGSYRLVQDLHATPSLEQAYIWQNPQTGNLFPMRWQVRSESLELDVVATVPEHLYDQFVPTTAKGGSYYEGAAHLKGHKAGDPVAGIVFLETMGAPEIRAR